MATYYVGPQSEEGDGSYADPWNLSQARTHLYSYAVAGDTVIFKSGLYTYSGADEGYMLDVRRSGASDNYITIKSENLWGAVLDGNASGNRPIGDVDAPLYGAHSLVDINYASYVRFEGLEIRNALWGGIRSNTKDPTSNYIKIYRCKIHDIGRRLDYKGIEPVGTVYGIVGVGTKETSHHWTIDSCYIYNIGRLNPELTYEHNWIHDHGWYGSGHSHTAINNVFENCIHGWCIGPAGNYDPGDAKNWTIVTRAN